MFMLCKQPVWLHKAQFIRTCSAVHVYTRTHPAHTTYTYGSVVSSGIYVPSGIYVLHLVVSIYCI